MTGVLDAAFASALAQYEETMGEPFPTAPRLKPVDEDAFWAEVQWLDQELTVLVTRGLVDETVGPGLVRSVVYRECGSNDGGHDVSEPELAGAA